MTICNKCGSEVKGGVLFCTECGARIESSVVPAPAQTKEKPPVPQTAPSSPQTAQQKPAAPMPNQPPQQPMPASQGIPGQMPPQPVSGKYNKPVSTVEYFFSILLYTIPVIGLISMIIVGFTAKNKSRRNYAKAVFLWNIIVLLIVALFVVWYFIWGEDTVKNFIDTEITTRLMPPSQAS